MFNLSPFGTMLILLLIVLMVSFLLGGLMMEVSKVRQARWAGYKASADAARAEAEAEIVRLKRAHEITTGTERLARDTLNKAQDTKARFDAEVERRAERDFKA